MKGALISSRSSVVVLSIGMEWQWELHSELNGDDGIPVSQGQSSGTYWSEMMERNNVTIMGTRVKAVCSYLLRSLALAKRHTQQLVQSPHWFLAL